MKIAFFTESYVPYISGVTRSSSLLAKELAKLGHDVTVYCPSYPGYKDSGNIKVKRLPSFPASYLGFRIAAPLPGFIGKEKFDIIHSHSPFLLGIIAARYAKRKGIPFVYTFHTLFEEYLHYVHLPRPIGKAVIQAYLKYFCTKGNAIIAPNNLSAQYLKSIGVKKRIELISSGIDCSLSVNASAETVSRLVPEGHFVLLYVGRLSKEKNIPFLFESLAKVIESIPNTVLLLVAGGPEKANLQKLAAKMGLDKNIIFAGTAPYPAVLDYYKCAHVFVFASKSETQGLVIAEAKSCGLTAVAINAGGVSSSICNGVDGYLTGDDAGEFAQKVVMLLKDSKLRERFCKTAKENAFRDFSSVNIAKRFEKVYNSLLSQ